LHLAGKVTLAASQSKPPGTRRIAQDDHDAPLFGHASDATPTPATAEYGAITLSLVRAGFRVRWVSLYTGPLVTALVTTGMKTASGAMLRRVNGR
ncbi:MAG: hypothetical protein JWO75_1501, partial [Actinomycetia bacterium]|nr:hypothetical protein [Actinomycetes bacterium]